MPWGYTNIPRAKVLHRIACSVELEHRREIRAEARTRGAAVRDPDRRPVGIDIDGARDPNVRPVRHPEVVFDRLIGIGQVLVGVRPTLRETEMPANDATRSQPVSRCACAFAMPAFNTRQGELRNTRLRQRDGGGAGGSMSSSTPGISGWGRRFSTRPDRPQRAARCGAPKSPLPGARRP